MLEGDEIKHTEMKRKIEKEYFCRVRKILKSKLNGGNMVQAMNFRAVAGVRYAAGMVEWTKEELQIMDRKRADWLVYNMLCIRRLMLGGFTLKDQRVVED